VGRYAPLLILALLVGVLALLGCSERDAMAEREMKAVEGYGVIVKVPEDWDGRIEWPSPEFARIVHLASFELPSELDARGHAAERRMGEGDVYLNIGVDPAFTASSPLRRLEIKRSDAETIWEGKVPEAAARVMRPHLRDGQQIQVWVSFGSAPTENLVDDVNQVIDSLRLQPAEAAG
jgi:hypothetical protein